VPTPCASKATRSKLGYVLRVARSHDRRRARAVAVPPDAGARARGATHWLGRADQRRLIGVRSRRKLERRHRPDPARRRPRRRGTASAPASRAMVRNWCSSTLRPMRRSSALPAKPASNRGIRWIRVRGLRTVHALRAGPSLGSGGACPSGSSSNPGLSGCGPCGSFIRRSRGRTASSLPPASIVGRREAPCAPSLPTIGSQTPRRSAA